MENTGLTDESVRNQLDEIEEYILSAFIKDPYILAQAAKAEFGSDYFGTPAAARLMEIIEEISSKGGTNNPLDPVLIRKRITDMGLNSVSMYLDRVLAHTPPRMDAINAYIAVLKERSSREKMLKIGENLLAGAHDVEQDVSETLSKTTRDIRELQKKNIRKGVTLIKDQMIEIVKEVNYRNEHGDIDTLGYSMKPFNDLNSALSGLRKGFIYGIAGAPRRGKTTFTLEIATTVAALNNVPVLFYTWEQTRKNLTYRLLAKETQINPDTLQRKKINSSKENELKFATGWRRMEKYMEKLYLIEGSREDTVERIKSHAYNAMQDFETEEVILFFDYLQKMPLSRNYDSEKFKVEELSTALKQLSLELNCPVVVISSLNKEGCEIDAEDSKSRPNIYHCKGSGDIEYDLDVAMIMSKDWEDSRELKVQMQNLAESVGKNPDFLPKVDIVNIHLDKNRDAPESLSPIVQYFFFIEANKFVELGFKVESDTYRFRKIEGVLRDLLDSGYIRFKERSAPVKREVKSRSGAPVIRLKT